MPYSIVDDGDEINIRATIIARDELLELAAKLKERAEGKTENLTTYLFDNQDVELKHD